MSDVIDSVLDALNSRDLEAFVSCYAPDATIEDGYDSVFVRGHGELRARYGLMFEELPDLKVEAISRAAAGSFVVQEERLTGRGEPEQHVAVYLVQHGVIARERLLR